MSDEAVAQPVKVVCTLTDVAAAAAGIVADEVGMEDPTEAIQATIGVPLRFPILVGVVSVVIANRGSTKVAAGRVTAGL
jgi:hypothetical protein